MTGVEHCAVTAAALIGMCAAVYGYARFEAWLEVHRHVARWCRQIRGLHSGHLDAWKPKDSGSGREPPR